LAKSEVKYWRITIGDQKQEEHRFESESLILGDWLRHSYISMGTEDTKQISRKRFDEMKDGDRIAVIVDEFLWGVGEIKGFIYRREIESLHTVRRNVIWQRIMRRRYDTFPKSVQNKLKIPHTVVPLTESDWNIILSSL
jgi:hypothetical protein